MCPWDLFTNDINQQPDKQDPFNIDQLAGLDQQKKLISPQVTPQFTPEQVEQIHAQQPALGKTDLGAETPGTLDVLKQSALRGLREGLTTTQQGLTTPFKDVTPEKQPQDYTSQLLNQPFTAGWNDPNWWIAHITHGTAASSPTLGTGLLGATGGSFIGPEGTVIGGAGGLGLGAVIQSIAPAYQAARARGLTHDQAVDEALTSSQISGAFAMLMGMAPGVSAFGRTAEGALKRPISEALAQIFGVQPTIAAGQVTTGKLATEGRLPTKEELATAAAEQVGVGATLAGAHALGRAAYDYAKQPPNVRPEVLPPYPRTQEPISFIDLIPDKEGVYGGKAGPQEAVGKTAGLLESPRGEEGPFVTPGAEPEPPLSPAPERPVSPEVSAQHPANRLFEDLTPRAAEAIGPEPTKIGNITLPERISSQSLNDLIRESGNFTPEQHQSALKWLNDQHENDIKEGETLISRCTKTSGGFSIQ